MAEMFNAMISLHWTMGDLINYVTWCNANGFDFRSELVLDTYVSL